MNRYLDCSDFSANTLAWFREGDEMSAGADDRFVEYESKSDRLRGLVRRSGLAVGSLAVGLLAIAWLATQFGS